MIPNPKVPNDAISMPTTQWSQSLFEVAFEFLHHFDEIFSNFSLPKNKASKISCGTSKRLWPHCALYRMIQVIFYYVHNQHQQHIQDIFLIFGNQDQLKGGLQKKERGFSRSTSNNLSTFTKLRMFKISSVLYLGRRCCFLIQ